MGLAHLWFYQSNCKKKFYQWNSLQRPESGGASLQRLDEIHFGMNSVEVFTLEYSNEMPVRDYISLGCPNALFNLTEPQKSEICSSFSIISTSFLVVRHLAFSDQYIFYSSLSWKASP